MIWRIHTLPDSAFWRQRTALDGKDYLLDFAWNGRVKTWFLSLFDADEVALVESIALVSNRPLLRRFRCDGRVPQGELAVLDPTNKISAADYAQLSDGTVKLFYFDAVEFGRKA